MEYESVWALSPSKSWSGGLESPHERASATQSASSFSPCTSRPRFPASECLEQGRSGEVAVNDPQNHQLVIAEVWKHLLSSIGKYQTALAELSYTGEVREKTSPCVSNNC